MRLNKKFKLFVNKWNRVSFIFVIFILAFFFIYVEITKDEVCMETTKKYLKISFNGIVLDKYIDYENHAEKTIKIKSNDSIMI